jgi:hypothetical protein
MRFIDMNSNVYPKVYASEHPFAVGFRHGRQGSASITPREAIEWAAVVYPEWSADDIRVYLNGRDDGEAGDWFRVEKIVSAE